MHENVTFQKNTSIITKPPFSMQNRYKPFIIFCFVLIIQNISAQENNDSLVLQNYKSAYNEITAMLENKNALSFEDAVFSMENAYYNNQLSKTEFKNSLDFHTSRIIELAYANKDRVPAQNDLENTGEGSLLLNWAIYTYITDTTYWKQNGEYLPHYPMTYQNIDPFGKENWETTQITSLLKNNIGNCFSLAALYYIFSERLHTDAYLTTAPEHIYIQHKGFDGNFYNIELTTHTFPGSGTIKAYTYTTHAAVTNGIALRRLNEKQAVALCLVQLAKGYEKKLKIKNVELRMGGEESKLCKDFTLQCAKTALQYDALSLNAMLLKAQVLEKETLKEKQKNTKTFHELENTVLALNNWGYTQMPKEMQETLLANAQGSNSPLLWRGVGGEVFSSITKTKNYYTLSKNKFSEIQPSNKQLTIGNTCFTITEQKIENISTYQLAFENEIDPVTFALSIDPLAGKYPSISPYCAMLNDPINMVDPDGAEVMTVYDKAQQKWEATPEGEKIAFCETISKQFTNASYLITMAWYCQYEAAQTAANLFSGKGPNNGPQIHPDTRIDGLGDAFRHAYWNALMARFLGEEVAKKIADAHELHAGTLDPNSPNYDPEASKMDLFNNELGRKIARENPDATPEQLKQLILEALKRGEGRQMVTNDKGTPIDKDGNEITQKSEHKEYKQIVPTCQKSNTDDNSQDKDDEEEQ